jgi:hypothetical protein
MIGLGLIKLTSNDGKWKHFICDELLLWNQGMYIQIIVTQKMELKLTISYALLQNTIL